MRQTKATQEIPKVLKRQFIDALITLSAYKLPVATKLMLLAAMPMLKLEL
jgi:hypothetical protein